MAVTMQPTDFETEMLARLVRIETRLSKLIAHLGLNPRTGEPVNNSHPHQHDRFTNQEDRHSSQPRERDADRR